MPDFLLEIGCEEIPARMIDAASLDLRDRIHKLLARERLPGACITQFDSPRRLAVLAAGIPATQPDMTEQVTGPSAAIAFKDGQPTPAAHAFAKKAGIDISKLEKITTAKGEYLSAKVTKKGRSASEVLAELLPKEINSIYWPKNMYWRKPGEVFVRPVRWLVALLDREVVPLEFDGIRAGTQSRGHRILAPNAIQIPSAGPSYVDTLRGAKVLGRSEREQQIRKALDAATRTIPGARWREDKSLLDTVVNLTEWPSAILGTFDHEFLELPEEVLVTVMRDHQKYFAVEDSAGKLLPHFLAVLNTDGDPQGVIRHGHERVLRARFNDARFFWQTDQKHPLRERVQWLKQVTFQKDLGSYYDKTLRVQRLCSWLCEIIRQSGMTIRPGVVHKAAYLAKTDLTTELVKEFTELQGVVGGLYARVQELDTELPDATRQLIAQAIYDQYKPESMEDSPPQTPGGAVLSIADKTDTIAGMFALGMQPTGSKDPFALRRQANGIVKTIAEHKFPLNLSSLFRDARETYRGSEAEKSKFIFYGGQTVFLRREGQPPDTKVTQQVPFRYTDRPEAFEVAFKESIASFFRERLEFYLRDVRGFAYDVVNAVLAAGYDDVGDVVARAEAVSRVRPSVDFESISASFKRMKNIARQADEAGKRAASAANVAAQQLTEAVARSGREATSKAENLLAEQIAQIAPVVEEMRAARNYHGALLEVAKLRPVIDNFFDKVMVMVDDPNIRANRLALLQTLLREFSTIADFSEIVTTS